MSNKPKLSKLQKLAILQWKEPMVTTSAQCYKCGGMYSLGYLVVCPKDSEWFCSPGDFRACLLPFQEHRVMSDEDMQMQFGVTRSELKEEL